LGATYLNIELEVRASVDLKRLSAGMGTEFLVNYCDPVEPGTFLLSGSISPIDVNDRGPDATAIRLCDLVEQLPIDARELWNNATDRVLDIGLDANLDRHCIVNLLAPETLMRIAKIAARLAVSVYAVGLENEILPRE
jgi:hypothetical protein